VVKHLMASGRHRLAEPTPFPTYLTPDPTGLQFKPGTPKARYQLDQGSSLIISIKQINNG